MSAVGPFAFTIQPDAPRQWRWRAIDDDGRVAQGAAPTRAAAAACVIRVLMARHLGEAPPQRDPQG
jgi:hypothetical protein